MLGRIRNICHKCLFFVAATTLSCVATCVFFTGCNFNKQRTSAPPTTPGEYVLEATLPDAPATANDKTCDKAQAKTWTDNIDIDKVAKNPWVIAGAFLLIQWFEIWYFNRTGRKSTTIDAAEAAMQPKLGIIQRVLYRLWRFVYFWKNKGKKDPDKEEDNK